MTFDSRPSDNTLSSITNQQKSSLDPLFWLYADEYRVYNVSIAKKLGSVNAAIILAELAQKHKYHKSRNELIEDHKHGSGWFYQTIEIIEDRTALTRREQDNAINLLERLGLIEKISFGMPAKRHFRLNEAAILGFFAFQKNNLDCTKAPNWIVQKRQTAHIDKEQQEEQQETKEAAPVFVKFGKFVKMKEEEYKDLIEKHGKPLIDKIISDMNDYCEASKPKGYSSYVAAIRQWVGRKKETDTKGKVNENPKELIRKRQLEDYNKQNGGFDDNVLVFE